ncbi:hypothetical protein VO01_04445 [Clavibacter michiganensis subsp. insidiosus]|uniref:Uncharacterized protein n=2 Tax=Clavibacter michiganensis TaxID=28447 RepID=A0A0D5CFP9_9MICO|nr:hypothetical protein VO01_04445 [Clavibacter michiganensis subsp. insidiosus]AWF98890.1 hypothetical protein BEH61_10280 [Clavibacter michiganensis subsp. insidiosus]
MLGATLGAAMATAVSAYVVAYQAVQTRKATKASVRAAEAAERNAEAAVAAAKVSERMLAQTEQARREAALPKITVHCPDFSQASVFRLKPRSETGWELLPKDFRLIHGGARADLDMFDEVAVRVPLTFINDGDESAVLTVQGLPFILEMAESYPQSTWVVPAHDSLMGFVMVAQMVNQWANYDPYRSEYDPAGSALLTAEVGAHRSASQTWQLIATGMPFRRDPDDDDVLVAAVTGTQVRSAVKYLGSDLSEPVEEHAPDASSGDA